MDPIDYSGAFANIQPPSQAFTQGLQGGVVLQQAQAEQAQQQAALAQKTQMQTDLAALSANPTPQAIAAASLKYPQLSEQFKRSLDMLTPAQQQAKIDAAGPVHAAVLAGEYGIAAKQLRQHADAAQNSGNDQEAQQTRAMADLIEQHPETAKITTGLLLSSALGADKYAEAFGKFGTERRADQLQGDLVRKGAADATAAEADARVAAGTIPARIQKPVEENLSAVAARRVAQYNADIAAANSETQRGQLTLERDKYVAEQAKTAGNAGQAQQDQLDTVQQAITTTQKLLSDPLLDSPVGIGSAIGKLLSYIPGTDNKDYRANVATLKAQLFLPAVAQLKAAGAGGALSDAEGKKLDAAVASLDPDMSRQAFKNNLGVVMAQMRKAQQKVLASPKTPTQGGGFVVNHPTFGKVSEGDINRLMKLHPGATREQVMTFLSQSGGAQ